MNRRMNCLSAAMYLGGKKILKCDLVEALRTDYMG